MIKDNQKYFNRLHLLVDAVVVAVAYLFAWCNLPNYFWIQGQLWGNIVRRGL